MNLRKREQISNITTQTQPNEVILWTFFSKRPVSSQHRRVRTQLSREPFSLPLLLHLVFFCFVRPFSGDHRYYCNSRLLTRGNDAFEVEDSARVSCYNHGSGDSCLFSQRQLLVFLIRKQRPLVQQKLTRHVIRQEKSLTSRREAGAHITHGRTWGQSASYGAMSAAATTA